MHVWVFSSATLIGHLSERIVADHRRSCQCRQPHAQLCTLYPARQVAPDRDIKNSPNVLNGCNSRIVTTIMTQGVVLVGTYPASISYPYLGNHLILQKQVPLISWFRSCRAPRSATLTYAHDYSNVVCMLWDEHSSEEQQHTLFPIPYPRALMVEGATPNVIETMSAAGHCRENQGAATVATPAPRLCPVTTTLVGCTPPMTHRNLSWSRTWYFSANI